MKRSETVKITSIRFHPDGLIMAIGLANGKIMIYDVRDMVMAQELEGPTPSSAVSQLEFSNKGIFLAASWTGSSSCRVYSLHKGFACNELTQEGMPVTAISFDLYGGFLAVGTEQNMIVSSYKNLKKILQEISNFLKIKMISILINLISSHGVGQTNTNISHLCWG